MVVVMGLVVSFMNIDNSHRLTAALMRYVNCHGQLVAIVGGEVDEVVMSIDKLPVDTINHEPTVVLPDVGIDSSNVPVDKREYFDVVVIDNISS